MTLDTPSTSNCAAYCGQLGYAYAGRSGSGNGNIEKTANSPSTCGCGSELHTGTQVDANKCDNLCEGSNVA